MASGTGKDAELGKLMHAAQEGDSDAYDSLLRNLSPLVRALVRARTQVLSQEDLEDLVQEILLSVHEARATYDPQRPFVPWLAAIARNRLVDRGRRESRRWNNEVTVENLPETFHDADANRRAELLGDLDAMRTALLDLPDGQKTALELIKIRGLSVKEASRESSTSVAALKVAVHRAVKTLRVKLLRDRW